MKKSIRRQMATIFIALVLAIMLLSALINSQFLGRYYIYNKQNTLISVYGKMEEAVQQSMSYEKMAEELLQETMPVCRPHHSHE